MDIEFTNILDKISFPFIIWKKIDDVYKCYYSNNNIQINYLLKDYILENDIKYFYDTIIEKKKGTQIITKKYIINVEYLNENTIFEYHNKVCMNDNVLSEISNKMRIPLTNIISILSFLDITEFTEDNRQYINIIKKSCFDIITIANNIIDIVNLENNKVILKQNKSKLVNILNDCYDIIKDDAEFKNVKLNITIDKNVPEIIIIDEDRLKQVIVKFATNAIKYTEMGYVVISVKLLTNEDCPFEIKKKKKYNLIFKIKDNGYGIDEEEKEKLDFIFGIKKNLINPKKSINFGLEVCKKIIDLMDGKIWYKSEKDFGTIFYFTIQCNSIEIL